MPLPSFLRSPHLAPQCRGIGEAAQRGAAAQQDAHGGEAPPAAAEGGRHQGEASGGE